MDRFRQTALWLGIILISLSWRIALHIVTAPRGGLAALVTACGALCLGFSVAGGAGRCHGGERRSHVALPATPAAVFLFTGISAGALIRLAPALHDIDMPGRLAPLRGWLYGRVGVSDGLATFWDGRDLETVRITFEGLGLYEIWFITAAAALTLLVFKRNGRVVVRYVGLVVVVGIERCV